MKGWHKETFRHSLAAHGVSTVKMLPRGSNHFYFASKDPVREQEIERKIGELMDTPGGTAELARIQAEIAVLKKELSGIRDPVPLTGQEALSAELSDMRKIEKYMAYLVDKKKLDRSELMRMGAEITALEHELELERAKEFPGYVGPVTYRGSQSLPVAQEDDVVARGSEMAFIEARLKAPGLSAWEKQELEDSLKVLKYGLPERSKEEGVTLRVVRQTAVPKEAVNASSEEVAAYGSAFKKMMDDVKASEGTLEYHLKVKLLADALKEKGGILERGGSETKVIKGQIAGFLAQSAVRHKQPEGDQFLEIDLKRHSGGPKEMEGPRQISPEDRAAFMRRLGKTIKLDMPEATKSKVLEETPEGYLAEGSYLDEAKEKAKKHEFQFSAKRNIRM